MTKSLEKFVSDCRDLLSLKPGLPEKCSALCLSMNQLIKNSPDLLEGFTLKSASKGYTRNLIHLDRQGLFSLYALVWRPGQWTPVHDHGTWGIVGVVSGALHERNFLRVDESAKESCEGVDLVEAGSIILAAAAVTSFVPNPDHIHRTGNPSTEESVVSLHLYGNAMAGFHIYNLEKKTRQWQEVSYK